MTLTPDAKHRLMHVVDQQLTLAMEHLGHAAQPALQLGLKSELVEAKEALVRLHSALSKIHREARP